MFNRRKIFQTGLVLMALLMLTGGCSKYDDGPVFSLYSKEKRFQGTWYFTRVKYNDVDSTDIYRIDPIQTLYFVLNTDKDVKWNAYTWNRNAAYSTSRPAQTDYGFWRMTDEKDSLLMVTTLSVRAAMETIADTTEYSWRIVRLAYTEMTLERMADDTTKIEWQLWKRTY